MKAIGAVNYMTIKDGRLIGHNNDGKCVVKAIQKVTPIKGKRVVMLGAGGVGRTMAVELAWAGASHLTLIIRRESQSTEVAQTVTKASGVPAEKDITVVEDITNPCVTPFLKAARDKGCPIVNGVEMLVQLALLGFYLFGKWFVVLSDGDDELASQFSEELKFFGNRSDATFREGLPNSFVSFASDAHL